MKNKILVSLSLVASLLILSWNSTFGMDGYDYDNEYDASKYFISEVATTYNSFAEEQIIPIESNEILTASIPASEIRISDIVEFDTERESTFVAPINTDGKYDAAYAILNEDFDKNVVYVEATRYEYREFVTNTPHTAKDFDSAKWLLKNGAD